MYAGESILGEAKAPNGLPLSNWRFSIASNPVERFRGVRPCETFLDFFPLCSQRNTYLPSRKEKFRVPVPNFGFIDAASVVIAAPKDHETYSIVSENACQRKIESVVQVPILSDAPEKRELDG